MTASEKARVRESARTDYMIGQHRRLSLYGHPGYAVCPCRLARTIVARVSAEMVAAMEPQP